MCDGGTAFLHNALVKMHRMALTNDGVLRVESKTRCKCTCHNPTSKLHEIPPDCNNPVKLLERPAHLGEMASPAWMAEATPEMWGGWAGNRQGSQSKVSGY